MFEKELVFTNMEFNNKWEVIEFLTTKAAENEKLIKSEIFEKAVIQREDEFSTAVGYEVAIPHGSSDTVKESFVAVCLLKKVMPWDNEEVRMIFMIGVPESRRTQEHLKILAWLSRSLMREEFRKQVMEAKDSYSLYNYLHVLETNEEE